MVFECGMLFGFPFYRDDGSTFFDFHSRITTKIGKKEGERKEEAKCESNRNNKGYNYPNKQSRESNVVNSRVRVEKK